MKKVIQIILFLAFISALASCNREVDIELESPQNVQITAGVLTWDAVDQAEHYIVFIDTTEKVVQTTSFNLNNETLAVGSYAITVVAVKADKLSLPSTVITYVVEAQASQILSAPANIVLSAGVLSWDSVAGATSYVVHVDMLTYTVTSTTLDLNSKAIPEGTYNVYINATAGTEVSANSQSVVYVVELSAQQNNIKLAIVKIFDPTYTLDLTETSFQENYQYSDYLDALSIAQAYSSSAMMLEMTETQAINLFTIAYNMVNTPVEEMVLDDVITEMAIFSAYNLDADDLANMIYELALALMDNNLRSIEVKITKTNQDLTNHEDLASNISNDPIIVALLSNLKTAANPSAHEALDKLFSGEHYDIIGAMEKIIDMVLNQGPIITDDDYKYNAKYRAYVSSLITMATAMNDTPEDKVLLQELGNKLEDLYLLERHHRFIKGFDAKIDNLESDKLMSERMSDTFSGNKEEIIASISVVIDFVLTIKDTMPQNLISLLDNVIGGQELTQTEKFTIIDELVSVLQTALPEPTDFEAIYNTMFVIVGSGSNTDMSTFSQYSQIMGQIHHESFDLGLDLLATIDANLIDEAMLILDDVTDEQGNIDLSNNPDVAIEFMLFIINHLDTFMTNEVNRVNALKALVTADFIEGIYIATLNILIKETTDNPNMEQQYKVMVTQFLTDMKLEFNTYKTAVEILGDTTFDVLSHLVSSEMNVIKKIMNLDQGEPIDQTLYLTDIAIILNEIHMIDIQIFDDLTATEIDVLFAATRLPLRLILETIEVDINFETTYVELLPKFRTVVLNAMTLQSDLMLKADELELVTVVLNPNLADYELGVNVAIITVVSQTLSAANESLILDTLDMIFDDVLGHHSMLTITGKTALEVADLKLENVNKIQGYIDEFKLFGALDFNNLSETQVNEINEFMSQFQASSTMTPVE